MKITNELLKEYYEELYIQEKARRTCGKYLYELKRFAEWCSGENVTAKLVRKYKDGLIDHYAPASVNVALAALNGFFSWVGHPELRVHYLRVQKAAFVGEEQILTKQEYQRLLVVAKKRGEERLYYLMQTICSTGIRVSETQYITVEAVNNKQVLIRNKGKSRQVILPQTLCVMLKKYAEKNEIKSGPVFVSRNGRSLDRSNIWSEMKRLCQQAGVAESKVFPHNLRHLFARTFYTAKKDVVRLADILGHSSINTTRIYTMETGEELRRQIQSLGLIHSEKTT